MINIETIKHEDALQHGDRPPEAISYRSSDHAWKDFVPLVEKLASRPGVRRIGEIGGGANPLLPLEFVKQHNLEYVVLDSSAEELRKAPDGYAKVQADIAARDLNIPGGYDLLFSKMVAEHVTDGRAFHTNVFNLLAPNGLVLHFFPTLFALPFFVNYLVPERLAASLTELFHPRDSYQHKKFPAYYHWCRGPLKSQVKKLEQIGFELVEYRGFFGHGDYYRKVPVVKRLHENLVRFLLKHPSPIFTSYAQLILRKP